MHVWNIAKTLVRNVRSSSSVAMSACPNCENGQYETVSGGDSAADPYPDR